MTRALVLGRAEDREHGVAHEDEPPVRAQQPRRLRNPAVGIAPDRGAVLGEREVEARVRQRRLLRVRLDEREVEPVLRLHRPRDLELARRQVDGHRPRPEPGEPRRPVCGAAAELDDVHPGHVRQRAQLGLGHGPQPPRRLLPRPVPRRRPLLELAQHLPVAAVALEIPGAVIPSAASRSRPSASSAPTRGRRRRGRSRRRRRPAAARSGPRRAGRSRGRGAIHSPYGRLNVTCSAQSWRCRPKYGRCSVGVIDWLASSQQSASNGDEWLNASRPPGRSTRAASGTLSSGSVNVNAPWSQNATSKLAVGERQRLRRGLTSGKSAPAGAGVLELPGGDVEAGAARSAPRERARPLRRRRSRPRARPCRPRRRARSAPTRGSATPPTPGRRDG